MKVKSVYMLTVEDGKLVRIRIFATKAAALEAAGLRVSRPPPYAPLSRGGHPAPP